MMNRRDILKAAAVTGSVIPVIGISQARAAPQDPTREPHESDEWVAAKFIELPLQPGDRIVGLTSHHGDLWAASLYGEIYRIY